MGAKSSGGRSVHRLGVLRGGGCDVAAMVHGVTRRARSIKHFEYTRRRLCSFTRSEHEWGMGRWPGMRRRWSTCWKRRFPSRLVHLIMPNAAVIRALDERIAVLERELLVAKKQRNALVLAASLPFEVLADILRHTQHPDGLKNARLPSLGYDRKWARTMLVCSLWRDVAIQMPLLWTIIDSEYLPWIRLCEERSLNMPFHLHGYNEHTERRISQAKSLVVLRNPASDQDVELGLSLAAPQMEALHMTLRYQIDIDRDFLQGALNALVHLALNGNSIEIHDAPPMPSLRFLELDNISSTFKWLARLWRQAPSLEILIISHPWIDPVASIANEHPVSLPRLRTLILVAPVLHTCTCLSILPPPGSVLGLVVSSPSLFQVSAAHSDVIYEFCESFLARKPGTYPGSVIDNLGMSTITFKITDATSFGHARELAQYVFSFYVNNLPRPRAPHPFLDRIDTMALSRWLDLRTVPCIDAACGARFMPRLRVLTVMECQNTDVQKMRLIKLWLQSRHGKIEQVRFVQCDPSVRRFSEELHREGVIPGIDWEDQP
jgi:hypothetical protein